MKKFPWFLALLISGFFLSGCATEGEFTRLGTASRPAKPESVDIPILSAPPSKPHELIGIVTARDEKLDKAVLELKRQGRLAGADALIEFKQERKFSMDYLADLYFVEAKAVAYLPTSR